MDPVAEFRRRFGQVVVIKKDDFRLEAGFFVVKRLDLESAEAAGEDVKTAIGIALDDLLYNDSTAAIEHAIVFGEDDAEFGTVGFGFTHHFAVAGLKNVQGHRIAGEGNELQWEHG